MTHLATRSAQVFALLWAGALPYSTAVAEIALAGSLLSLLAAALRNEIFPGAALSRWSRQALILWGGFLFWILFAHLFAVDQTSALRSLPKLYRFAGLLPFALLPWDRRFRVALYCVFTALVFVLALDALPPFLQQRVDRISSARLHYNTLAQISASLSLILAVAAAGERRCAALLRGLWAAGSLVATAMLMASLSRVAWAAWLSALPLIVLLAVPPRRRWIFALVALLLTVGALQVDLVRERVEEFTEFDDPQFVRRYDMWAMGGTLIREHPWTGVGPSGIARLYDEVKVGMLVDDPHRWVHLHNDLVTTAATFGIPGAVLWLILAAAMVALTLSWLLGSRDRQPPPLAIGAALSIHVFLLCGMLHDTLPIYRKFGWYLLLWGLLIHAQSKRALEGPDR